MTISIKFLNILNMLTKNHFGIFVAVKLIAQSLLPMTFQSISL